MRLVRIVCIAVSLAVVLGVSQAGEIWGFVYDPDGFGFYNTPVGANIAGDNQSGCGLSTTTDDPANFGLYWMGNLPGGVYSLGCAEKDYWGRQYSAGLTVPGSGSVGKHFYCKPNVYVAGTTYFHPGCAEIRQSFTATGTSVIAVALREAAGIAMRVTIHQGDVEPLGSQIGPARVVPSSGTNGQAAFWSAGEVPTTPGQLYTVRIKANGSSGIWPFIQTVFRYGGSRVPTGRTWRDGSIVPEPPDIAITSDDDGIISTVCTARAYASTWGTVIGQSFKAKGRSVLGVTFLAGDSGKYAISIHDGVGSGQGGAQIGPTKYQKAIPWNNRTVVTWAPGEVPVTPGQTYFVKLRHVDGSGVTLYTTDGSPTGSDEYADGQLYRDGTAVPGSDLSVTIFEEESSGSTSKPWTSVSGISVSTTSTTATITWNTSPALRGRVDWSKLVTPYTGSYTESSAVTSHSVTLTGLEPNTMYHFRVGGIATGYRETMSEDTVFCTAAASGTNLLGNPGFESGTLASWTKYGVGDIALRNYPSGGAGWFGGATAHTGSWFLGGAGNGTKVSGGVYQTVSVTPGIKIKASMWLWTHTEGNFRSEDAQTWGRIGIDPTGGTNPYSANIKWTLMTSAQQRYVNIGVEATATSNKATIFCYAGVTGTSGYAWTVFAIDDVVCTQEIVYTPMTISQAKASADGTYVALSDLRVTALPSAVTAYYVEQPDRACGIRVESAGTALEGEAVSINGAMGTKSSGERYVANAVFTSRISAGSLKPVAMQPAVVGGLAVGIKNVGMLVTTWGRVTSAGAGYVTINDGSLVGNGLRVITSLISPPPELGQMVIVTGVVELIGSAGSPTVIVCPRRLADIVVY